VKEAYHCCWGAYEQQTILLQLLTHISVFKAIILLEMVPSKPYARQFLVCGTSRRKVSRSYIMRAEPWTVPIMCFSSFTFPLTARSKATTHRGKANFFRTVEGQHNLHDGRNVFPSMPYYSNMLHNTLYVMLGASLLHHEYKLTRIPKRNSAQTPFLFHPPIICPLSYHTGCTTRYQSRHFFNNSNTNKDIATKFEQEYVRCVRNVTTS
jgi:hypothetical protein